MNVPDITSLVEKYTRRSVGFANHDPYSKTESLVDLAEQTSVNAMSFRKHPSKNNGCI